LQLNTSLIIIRRLFIFKFKFKFKCTFRAHFIFTQYHSWCYLCWVVFIVGNWCTDLYESLLYLLLQQSSFV